MKGFDGYVRSMFVDSVDNILYVGGWFTQAGGTVPCGGIAIWDGNNWNGCGLVNSDVLSMAIYKGDLYAGGAFSDAGGVPVNYIARWDGQQWDSLGHGSGEGAVFSLKVYKDELYAGGGYFKSPSGDTIFGLARWYMDTLVDVRQKTYKDKVYLGNNIPNPAKQATTIFYNIPAGKNAKLDIHDLQGKLAGSYNLQAYSDSIEISLNGWEQGTYLFSMIIDGRKVQTKKMVVSR